MTEPEADAVVEMLQRCENPPMVEVSEALGTTTGVDKPETTEERRTGRERKPQRQGKSTCRPAKAEAWVTRRRWSRVRGTGTGTEWSASDRILRVRA